jgi:DNA-binding transcriptional regulator GbsR (MarR family)
MSQADTAELVADVRRRMIDIGGRAAQDLGFGRVVGQIMFSLYLQSEERSLDEIAGDLGLSKAAVSIGLRQLESLGLVKLVWRKGDRRHYYRTADNIAAALQQGLLTFLRQKMQAAGVELAHVNDLLETAVKQPGADGEIKFLHNRVARAKQLRDRASGVLENPIVSFFMKA